MLIENEITRCHAFQTMEEALCLLRHVCTYNSDDYHHGGVLLHDDASPSSPSLLSLSVLSLMFPLKSWLNRDHPSTAVTVKNKVVVTRDMLQAAMRYEVMFHKMLRWHHQHHQQHQHHASSTTDTGTVSTTVTTTTTTESDSDSESWVSSTHDDYYLEW